jgi:hypothetical protein
MSDQTTLYTRALPGGGYVSVEAEVVQPNVHRGHVAVERRADPTRRDGHTPPVIAVVEGPSSASVFHELYAIASDNVSIARQLMRWQAHRNT